jgi:GNAT superfamily N-acetyltransferase
MTDPYEISTDSERLDVDRVHRWLSTDAYWAIGRSRETVEQSIRASLTFGVYAGAVQVGFARVVTDLATFAWVCDVYVDPAHRGRGLGKRLASTIVAHLAPYGLRLILLRTQDAHGVYAASGFTPLPDPESMMELRPGS